MYICNLNYAKLTKLFEDTMNNNVDIQEFDYILPDERIAKYPLLNRDNAKMLIYNNGELSDDFFYNLPLQLPKNTALCFNNTKVLYARLLFQKSTGANIEIFCLEPFYPNDYSVNLSQNGKCQWKCLVGNLKKWKDGAIALSGNRHFELTAQVVSRETDYVIVEFSWNNQWSFADILAEAGAVPIPPYLNRASEEVDKETYQTLYSKIEGSVAAPTAGLHFTPGVLNEIDRLGINRHEVTLHVGAGTFRPVSSSNVVNHIMHQEYITVQRSVIESLKHNEQIIYAVGTTTVRTLESLYWIGVQVNNEMPKDEVIFHVNQWEPYNKLNLPSKTQAIDSILEYMNLFSLTTLKARTSIIIVPGYNHKIVNGLITNFHQPRSTLLLLLASFVGDRWREMYQHALNHEYRFLSYGDSCLIHPSTL